MNFVVRKFGILITTVAALACSVTGSNVPTPPKSSVLALVRSIAIPGIAGDFDHFAADLKGNKLFLAAEEHGTVEVFDLSSGRHIRSIKGFDTPHGLLFLAETNELLVVDGGAGGACDVVKADTYTISKKIPLSPDADAIAFDKKRHLAYITNGGKEAGHDYSLISIIDTTSKQHVGDIRVPSSNLEAIALEENGTRLFVNIRDKNQIGVIDRDTKALSGTWKLTKVSFNTPLAIDEADHRLFVAGRKPGRFGVLDTETGKEITDLPVSELVDDMSFDPSSKRVYVACGEGFVHIFEKNASGEYHQIAKVPTGYKAKIGYLVPETSRYFVVTAKHGSSPAKLLIFAVNK